MLNQLTWFFGIVSIIQMVFLPGFILCKAFKLEQALASRWATYFLVSLLANYLLVYCLTSLHLYTSEVLRTVVMLEAIVALGMAWQSLWKCPSWELCFLRVKAYWQMGAMQKWVAGFALVTLAGYAWVFITSQGQVFGYWDPTVSYNPWAIEWAGNAFPTQTWDYPQLLPCNWSLAYVLIGRLNWGLPLEFFPTSIMALFAFFMLLILWEKMLDERNVVYGLALIIIGLLIGNLLSVYIGLGYADIPASAMAFAAVIILHDKDFQLNKVLLGSALCAAAALTKQAGLWLALVYPLLSYFMLRDKVSARKMLLLLSLQIFILLILILSWYGLAWWGFLKTGLEWSYLTHGIYQQASTMERLQKIWQETGLMFWFCFIISFSYSCKKGLWRVPFLLIALPLVVIWAFFFSYDNRNLSMALPFIGLMTAETLYQLSHLAIIQKGLSAIKKGLLNISYFEWIIMALVAVLLIGFQPGFRMMDLNAYQVRTKQKIGYSDLNHMLVQYQAQVGFHGKILTAWPFLFNDLPAISALIQPVSPKFYGPNMLPDITQSKALLLEGLKAAPSVHYILVDKMLQLTSAAVYQYLATLQQAGKLEKIGETSNFVLYEINKPLN